MRPSISFCTTCRNRLWQIKETLPKNLESINETNEIVLVDYGSTDGLSEWVWKHFEEKIQQKKLKFFEVKNEVRWNVARAKNLAHRLAKNDYLFNLDADNFITLEDIKLISKFAKLGLNTHQWSKTLKDGSFGRIGSPRELFMAIGGYDETMFPMGGQDVDILNRLYIHNKKKIISLGNPVLGAVQNSASEKIKEVSMTCSNEKNSEEFYQELNKINLKISKFKLESEGPVRIGGGFSYKGLLNGKMVVINGFDEIFFEN